MKKLISLLLALSLLPMSGCTSLYSNFRSVEELLVMQTMGLDRITGGVRLSLAAGGESSPGDAPVRLEGAGSSITTALDQARNSSFEQELFFTNIDSLIIGESAARAGIDDYMTYVCQSPMLRIDIPVFIVRGGSAADCVIRAGDEQSSVSDILKGIRDSLRDRGDGHIFSAAQIIRSTQRHGGALVCALELIPSSQSSTGGGRSNAESSGSESESSSQVAEQLEDSEKSQERGETEIPENSGGSAAEDGSKQNAASARKENSSGSDGEEKFSPAPVGLAVLKNNRLCAWIEQEDVLGVGFLLDKPAVSDITMEDGKGQKITVQINEGSCRFYPIWANDGSLMRLDIAAHAAATVLEADGGSELSNGDYIDELTALLENYIYEKISRVLALSAELGTDFLGLGSRVEQRDAAAFRRLGKSFSSLLPALELRISVSAQLSHTSDIKGGRV